MTDDRRRAHIKELGVTGSIANRAANPRAVPAVRFVPSQDAGTLQTALAPHLKPPSAPEPGSRPAALSRHRQHICRHSPAPRRPDSRKTFRSCKRPATGLRRPIAASLSEYRQPAMTLLQKEPETGAPPRPERAGKFPGIGEVRPEPPDLPMHHRRQPDPARTARHRRDRWPGRAQPLFQGQALRRPFSTARPAEPDRQLRAIEPPVCSATVAGLREG